MSAEYFLDTNILAYCFDRTAVEKRTQALKLVRHALSDGKGIISSQVVQEFLNIALRRFAQPFSPTEAKEYLDLVLMPLCAVYPSTRLYEHAIEIMERWRFSFYDSLIVAAAIEGGCKRLITEDLQDGQTIETVVIENPFRNN
jgi:predicted nucleic acid-binding protein